MPPFLCSRLLSQKSWSGCPPWHQKSMQTASTPDKSEVMVWVSSAAPATEYVDCLYSRQVRNHGLGVLHGTCNRVCGLPLLQSFLSHVKSEFRSLSSHYEWFPCTCTMM